MQDGTTADLIFDVPALISFISRQITLEPGDLIATGTPGGRRRVPRPAGLPRARRPRALRDRGHRRGGESDRRLDRRPAPRTTERRTRAAQDAGERRCSRSSRPPPAPASSLSACPEPGHRHQRRPDPRPQDRHLRHGPPHRSLGRRGRRRPSSRRSSWATSSSARCVEVGQQRVRLRARATSSAARATSSAACAATASPAAATCARTRSASGVDRDGAFAEYVVLPMTNVWHHWPGIDEEVAAIFDPFGNAVHTALAFPVLGEDVLVIGAGPIGLMATAVARHAGARYVVVTRAERFRRELAERMGATLAVDPRERDLARRPARARAWSRASTSRWRCRATPAALRGAIATWPTAAAIAILGIPTEEITLDINQRRVQAADDPGHLRPGDVRDLVQDVGDAPVGAGHHARDHPPLPVPRARGRVRGRPLGRLRQGHHGLDRT